MKLLIQASLLLWSRALH